MGSVGRGKGALGVGKEGMELRRRGKLRLVGRGWKEEDFSPAGKLKRRDRSVRGKARAFLCRQGIGK